VSNLEKKTKKQKKEKRKKTKKGKKEKNKKRKKNKKKDGRWPYFFRSCRRQFTNALKLK